MARTLDQLDQAVTALQILLKNYNDGLQQTLRLNTSTLEGELQTLSGLLGLPLEGTAPATGLFDSLANLQVIVASLATQVAASVNGVLSLVKASSTQSLGDVGDGQGLQTASWALPGATVGCLLLSSVSVPFPLGVWSVAKIPSPNTVLVEIYNYSGVPYTIGTVTFTIAII